MKYTSNDNDVMNENSLPIDDSAEDSKTHTEMITEEISSTADENTLLIELIDSEVTRESSQNVEAEDDIIIEDADDGADGEILTEADSEINTDMAYDSQETDVSVNDDGQDSHVENTEDNSDVSSDAHPADTDAADKDADTKSPAESKSVARNRKTGKGTDKKSDEKPRVIDNIFDFVELFVFTLAAVFIVTSFFFRYSIVDGGSMDKTLKDDEKLILRSFLYEPDNGDIVVVQDKSTELKQPIVKRIIATEGQTVRFYSDAVYVDGKELDEPYVYTEDFFSPLSSDYTYDTVPNEVLLPIVTDSGIDDKGRYYEITVPKDEIFVMGDHRNVSKDSRAIGTIHEDAVIGKVVLRFYPFDKFGTVD